MKILNDQRAIEVNDELIVRYLAGEAGPEEAMALEDALADPAVKEKFAALESAWYAARPDSTPRQVSSQNAWTTFEERLVENVSKTIALDRRKFLYRIAASIALVVASGAALFLLLTKNADPANIMAATEANTKRVQLSDRSQITLYHETTLSYPEKFDDKLREVELLEGEAYFSISPNKEKPFIVHTSLGDIRVVGTAFNVTIKDGQMEVGVNEGTVMVMTANDSRTIDAGFSAVVTPSGGQMQVNDGADANAWAYATGRFSFEDAEMDDVLSNIEKTFAVSIRLRNEEIRNCRVTASFNKVSVEKMLNLIAETLSLTVDRNGTEYILEGEGCP